MFAYTTYSWKCLLLMSRADPGLLSGGGGRGATGFFSPGGRGFQLLPQKYNTLNFHIQADVSHLYLFNKQTLPVLTTRRSPLIEIRCFCVCFLEIFWYFIIYFFPGERSEPFQGGGTPSDAPLDPPMYVQHYFSKTYTFMRLSQDIT